MDKQEIDRATEEEVDTALAGLEDENAPARIKHWKPVHDRVLALHMAGYKNVNIASIVGFTQEHVSKVLNDPRAKKAIKKAQRRLRQNFHDRIKDRMLDLGEEAVENIAQTIEADISPATKPKKHQDKVSFDLLDRLGHDKADEREEEGSVKLSEESVDRLADALDRSDKAKRLWERNGDGEWREADTDEEDS